MSQLVLPLRLADHAVFDSFLAIGNEVLVAALAETAAGEGGHGCWLWGAPATGKTHLLQATCDRAGDSSVYVPLSMFSSAGPAILEGLAELDTTVVIVAYRRSSIVLAEEVIFIEDGRITGRGVHADLYATLPAYRELIDAYDTEGGK